MQGAVTSINHYITSSNHQVTTKKIEITAKQGIFDIKTSMNPLIRGKFGPKNEIHPNAIKGAL